MIQTRLGTAFLTGGALLGLAACADVQGPGGTPTTPLALSSDALRMAYTTSAEVDPSTYAGDVQMRVVAPIPTEASEIPATVFIGFTSVSDTRLGLRAFIDLRNLQAELSSLIPDVIEDNCAQLVGFELHNTEAVGTQVIVRGRVDAEFFTCRSETERGRRWFRQSVDIAATTTASLDGICVEFRLTDLELKPLGAVGTVSDWVGLTNRVRAIVLSEAETFLADSPICPGMPDELAMLKPQDTKGGPMEVGDGGLGAVFSGSVDVDASTLIALAAILSEKDLIEGQQ